MYRFTSALLLLVFMLLASSFAEDLADVGLPTSLVDEEQVEEVTELVFTEGPAYHADGSVFFTDLANNRILRWVPGATDAHEFLTPSGRANGLMFDRQGGLLACEGNEHGGLGGRRLVRYDVQTRTRTVIADRYKGKRFNSPNDLCIDEKGRIYFTDPYYGPFRDDLDMEVEGVYRVDADGSNLIRVLGDLQVRRPNGIAISADNRTLYVVDAPAGLEARHSLLAFTLDAAGDLSGKGKVLHDFGRGRGGDGMAIDKFDNLYVAAGTNRLFKVYPELTLDNPRGVYVFSSHGGLHGIIPIPEDMVANCCFGGPDLKTLYITAGKTLWKIRTKVPGRVAWPPAQE